MFQVPTHLTEALRFLDCVSSTVHRSPYCQTVLNADGRVYTVTCVRLFYLFSNTSFCNFSHLRIVFLLLFLFFIVLFLYLILYTYFFHRSQLYSSSRFIRHNYPLVCFNFNSSQSSRSVRYLSPHVPPHSYPPPLVVAIVSILSSLE